MITKGLRPPLNDWLSLYSEEYFTIGSTLKFYKLKHDLTKIDYICWVITGKKNADVGANNTLDLRVNGDIITTATFVDINDTTFYAMASVTAYTGICEVDIDPTAPTDTTGLKALHLWAISA